jgi:WD40 repeat protein
MGVTTLDISPDGRVVASGSGYADSSIRFWDTSTWTEERVLRGHTDEVRAVATSESAQLVASAGKDANLMLWRQQGKSAPSWEEIAAAEGKEKTR